MKGLLGSMFDFDGDGDLNPIEQAAEFSFLDSLLEDDKKDSQDWDDDDLSDATS